MGGVLITGGGGPNYGGVLIMGEGVNYGGVSKMGRGGDL